MPPTKDKEYSAPPYLPPATTSFTRTTPSPKAATRPRPTQPAFIRPNIVVRPTPTTIEQSQQQRPKPVTPKPLSSRQPKQQRFPTTTKPRPTTKAPLKVNFL